ncbi:histidine kinase [Saccharopolyspora shandongensis]|uniref:sensor histidine kinase n=1 Tax=Saccharopolyspora shandongensis TaxID=418495 RepID=UPI0033F677A6
MPFPVDRERLLSWWDGKVRSLLLDLAVALLFGAGPIVEADSPWAVCVILAAGLGLLVRRRFPGAAVAPAVAVVAFGLSPLPASIALYTFARRHGPGRSLWFVCSVTIAAEVAAEMVQQQGWHGFPMLLGIAVKSVFYGAPAMLGLWLHQRQVLLSVAHERIERAERERALLAERAVVEERRRIARELHDVIAHRASVMSLQAGALTMHARDQTTADTAEVIRDNSAKALTELRGMLRVLRDGPSGHDGDLVEVPTVRDIAELVRDSVEAGSTVRLTMPEELPETSGTTGRAAYRVVQEALTNAARHAPDAAVRVDVEAGDDLVITVANGPGRKAGTTAGFGYGLLGMRERVALADGSLQAGPSADGGYRVAAVLPLHAANPG